MNAEIISTDSVYETYTRHGRTQYSYYPILTYRYIVKNKEYTEKEKFFNYKKENQTIEFLNSHTPGTKHKIYYNPDNPKEALSNPGSCIIDGIIVLVLGFAFITIPIIIYIHNKSNGN